MNVRKGISKLRGSALTPEFNVRTFVHHNGALGDTLLSLPCFLRIKSGSSHLHIAAGREVAGFLQQAGVAHAASSSGHRFFAPLYAGAIEDGLRSFLAGFDRAYVFTTDPGSAAVASIRRCIVDTSVIRTVPPNAVMPVFEYRLAQLGSCGVRDRNPAFLLDVPEKHRERARLLLQHSGYGGVRTLLALHPGSGGRKKCWPLENYFKLIDRMQSALDAFVIIFSGPAEDGELKTRIEQYVRSRKNLLHASDPDLITAAALLAGCRIYIGNDSGFTHLAAASCCSTLVLFGPTDPLLWRPAGPRVALIGAGRGWQATVDTVFQRAVALTGPDSEETRFSPSLT